MYKWEGRDCWLQLKQNIKLINLYANLTKVSLRTSVTSVLRKKNEQHTLCAARLVSSTSYKGTGVRLIVFRDEKCLRMIVTMLRASVVDKLYSSLAVNVHISYGWEVLIYSL